MDRGELVNLIHAETWMSAEEAIENGFATSAEENRIAACYDKHLDMASRQFRNMPKNIRKKSDLAREEAKRIKKDIEDFLARK